MYIYKENIPVGALCELAAAAFQTNVWHESKFSYYFLKHAHRQTG
jgi:hypothetical protein